MKLIDRNCSDINKKSPPLDDKKKKEYFSQLNKEWSFVGRDKLVRIFEFEDYMNAVEFVNKVANIADSENHHPDTYLSYKKVEIELSTHAIKGLSENDFILAAKIDTI